MLSSASGNPRSRAKTPQAKRTKENNGGAFGELTVVEVAFASSVLFDAASTPD